VRCGGLRHPRARSNATPAANDSFTYYVMKVLIVEDDHKLAALLRRGLSADGHAVDVEHDGDGGYRCALRGAYDVVVLDLMLPKRSGLSLLRELREHGATTPVLILTARDETEDVVTGFNAGADDYLRKPFALNELLARLRTLARRAAVAPRLVLRVDSLSFDTATKEVTRAGREVQLTGKELAYLEYFLRNTGRVITRRMLEDALWDRTAELSSNVIDVYIGRLRSKIEFPDLPPLLVTVRGVGYRFG
jgi:DNA-binding response OmpR family regulator